MLTILTQRSLKLGALGIVKLRRKFLGKDLPPAAVYYFAYGANLDPKRFEKYGMNALPIGPARLDDYALKFTLPCEYIGKGYASIEPETGKAVWGFLYQLDRYAFLLLEAMEYVFLKHYRKIEVEVATRDGVRIKAVSLRTGVPMAGLVPSTEYKKKILSAAEQHGFPASYLSELQQVSSRDVFPLDHGFSLLFPARRRFFERALRPIYQVHDRVREHLCEFLRF